MGKPDHYCLHTITTMKRSALFSLSVAAALLLPMSSAMAQPDPKSDPKSDPKAANAELTKEQKKEILDGISEIIAKYAYVPGIDFTKWSEYLAGEQTKIDEAKDSMTFANEVNKALSKFSASHIVLNTPESAEMLVKAEFVGLGIQPQLTKEGILVNYVFAKSAAAEAGIEPGDTILTADGKPIKDLAQLRGAEGSKITITFRKGTSTNVVKKTVTRCKFSTKRPETIKWIKPDTALVEIPSFMTYDFQAVDKIMTEAQKAKSVIVDLRGNGGGQVIALLHLCGYFVPSDKTLGAWVTRGLTKKYVEETKGKETDLPAILQYALKNDERSLVHANANGKTQFTGKVAVLIDGGTGSASEMFAAAMKENRDAVVVGSKSAGAVLASRLYPLKYKYMLQYPFQDYITVKGLRLEGAGVEPNVKAGPRPAMVGAKDAGVEAALEALSK